MLCLIVIPTALFCTAVATKTDYKCPDGYTLNEMDRTCIQVHAQPRMKHDDAQEVCRKENGSLAQPQGIASNMFISGLLAKRKRYWIGVKKTTGDDVSYVDGSLLSFEAPWACGEPNGHRGDEGCVEMIANNPGSWNDKRCNEKRPFVCQTRAEMVDTTPYYLVSCDFESPCHYSPTANNNPVQVLTKDPESFDHTKGTSDGHFLAPKKYLRDIRLYTGHYINVTEESCLSFYFKGMKAELYIVPRGDETTFMSPPAKREDFPRTEKKKWALFSKTIPPLPDVTFQIWVYANYNRGIHAGLDDITFQSNGCTST